MKIKKQSIFSIIMCIMLALSLTLSLAACTDENKSGSDESASGNSKVLAEVEGTKITQGEVDDMARFLLATQYAQYGYKLDTLGEPDRLDFTNSMLINYVDSVLIRNYVAEKDKEAVEKEASEVDAQIADVISQSAMSGTDIIADITSAGATESTMKVYFGMMYYQSAFSKLLEKEMPATDQEIQEVYTQYKTSFITPASIDVSHILITDETHSEAGRTSIEAILKLAEDGEDFAGLAEKYSQDPGNATAGGVLAAPVTPDSQYVQEFKDASLKLKKKGDISPVVETQFGYHIIKADTDLIPEQQIPVESVRDEIVSFVMQNHYTDFMKKLKEEHADSIKYFVDLDPTTSEPAINNVQKAEAEAAAQSTAPAVEEPAVTTPAATTGGATGDVPQ